MSRIICSIALLLSAFGAYGQNVDSNSITVLVSRNVTLSAEQVQFQVSVSTGIDADLGTVTAALGAAGVPGVTFTGVSNQDIVSYTGQTQISTPTLTWQFTFSVPYANLHNQLVALPKSVQSLAKATRFTMTFALNGSTVADATVADATRKLLPDLIADARKRAAALADAAGVTVGSILGITDAPSSAIGIPTAIARVYPVGGSATPTSTVTYAISVKFQLLRY